MLSAHPGSGYTLIIGASRKITKVYLILYMMENQCLFPHDKLMNMLNIQFHAYLSLFLIKMTSL